MTDPVNRPAHYTTHPSGVECIEITRHHTFNVGNVIKYLWRAGLKDKATHLEDLKKARWYLDDEIMSKTCESALAKLRALVGADAHTGYTSISHEEAAALLAKIEAADRLATMAEDVREPIHD